MMSVVMLSIAMLSVIMLSVIMLSVIMLCAIMLSVFMLSVVMLSVAAPFQAPAVLLQSGTTTFSKTTLNRVTNVFATLKQLNHSRKK
jgi:hypothetical protein